MFSVSLYTEMFFIFCSYRILLAGYILSKCLISKKIGICLHFKPYYYSRNALLQWMQCTQYTASK